MSESRPAFGAAHPSAIDRIADALIAEPDASAEMAASLPEHLGTAVVRFWSRVQKTESCWLWAARCDAKGYGRISIRTDWEERAHRLSWMIARGPIPDRLCVLHRCDVRACVRPDHLFLGTQIDNIYDMVAKRRHTRGENAGMAKLTATQVRQIRDLYATGTRTYANIGQEFGIHPVYAGQIIRFRARTRWESEP